MIKAILFDIDGVLLDSFEANLKLFQNLLTQAGYAPPTREEYRPLFHRTMVDALRIMMKTADETQVQRVWELGLAFSKTQRNVDPSKMPEGARAVIMQLSEDFLLGLVTSRLRENVYAAPDLAALRSYFRTTVAFQDTEIHKPNPEPLLFAAAQLGVQPTECVYVGDVENDVKAAYAAGMKAVVYSKEKLEQADGWTSDFTKLPEAIASLT